MQDPRDKWAELIIWRTLLQSQGKTIVATNGCFDIIHAGHIHMLEEAAKLGDYLVVGINSDTAVRKLKGATRPIHAQEDRQKVLEAIRYVSKVVVFNSERATQFLSCLCPNVYVKAGDYSLASLNPEEREALEKCGTKIHFTGFIKGLSTTRIVKSVLP